MPTQDRTSEENHVQVFFITTSTLHNCNSNFTYYTCSAQHLTLYCIFFFRISEVSFHPRNLLTILWNWVILLCIKNLWWFEVERWFNFLASIIMHNNKFTDRMPALLPLLCDCKKVWYLFTHIYLSYYIWFGLTLPYLWDAWSSFLASHFLCGGYW